MTDKMISGIIIFTALLTFTSARASFEGGVRNGGTGVKCGNSIRVLDDFLANPTPISPEPDSVQLLTEVSRRMEPFTDFRGIIFHQFSLIRSWRSLPTGPLALVTADATLASPLPSGCKLVQLSYFERYDSVPTYFKAVADRLSEYSRTVLELHEAAYMAGTKYFGHENPVLTQRLMAELLRPDFDAPELEKVINEFIHFSEPLPDEPYGNFELEGYGPTCPEYIHLFRTGGSGSQLFYYFGAKYRKVELRERFRLLFDGSLHGSAGTVVGPDGKTLTLGDLSSCRYRRLPGFVH